MYSNCGSLLYNLLMGQTQTPNPAFKDAHNGVMIAMQDD